MSKELDTTESKTLSLFIDVNPIKFLQDENLETVLKKLGEDVRKEVHTVDTEEGRSHLSDHISKVKKSITYIHKAALDHARELKAAPNIFDAKRKLFNDFMSDLKDDLMKPLLEWESEGEKHLLEIENKVTSLMIAGVNGELVDGVDTLEGVEAWVKTAMETVIDESFQDSQEGAERFLRQSLLTADGLIARYQKEAEEAAQVEQDRLEQVAKDKAEYEAKVKKDAEEAAEKAAQETIDAEKLKAEKAKVDAENAEKQRAAQAIIDRDNAVKAEADRVQKIADDKADEERAKVKAELDRKAAIVVKERAVKEAAEKKASTQKHRQKVYDEMLAAFDKLGVDRDKGKATIKVIAEGNFPYIKLDYVNK